MNNPDRIVPPEEGQKLFKKLRDDIATGVEIEIPEDEPKQILPTDKEIANAKIIRPKEFRTGAGAQHEWEAEMEKREDEKRKAA